MFVIDERKQFVETKKKCVSTRRKDNRNYKYKKNNYEKTLPFEHIDALPGDGNATSQNESADARLGRQMAALSKPTPPSLRTPSSWLILHIVQTTA
jgi:hypothetical protein